MVTYQPTPPRFVTTDIRRRKVAARRIVLEYAAGNRGEIAMALRNGVDVVVERADKAWSIIAHLTSSGVVCR